MRKYLHDYERHLKNELRKLEEATISKSNKKMITEYYNFKFSMGVSVPRLVRVLGTLRLSAEKLKKDFDKVDRKDYEALLGGLRLEGRAKETIDTYIGSIKCFHKWLHDGETYPDSVRWMKTGGNKSKKLPEDLLTQEDVKKLLANSSTIRDKALVSCLWESGARIGEIGGLQIKNVSFDKFGCQLMVDGKTGMRRIRLVNATPDLVAWINDHPKKDDRLAPLWVNLNHNWGQQMMHRNIMKVLANIGRAANIKKPINPHHFRHSRATYMSQFLTEAQMKEYFGWTQDSKMAARYIHLSGKQVDDAILRMHGLKEADKKEDILKRNDCPRCKEQNPVTNDYCSKCWLPLTQEAAQEAELMEKKEQTGMVALMKLLNQYKGNPEKLIQTLKIIDAGVTQ